MKTEKIRWEEYIKYCYELSDKIKNDLRGSAAIVTLPRGGYFPSAIISYQNGIPNIFSYGYCSYKNKKKNSPNVYQQINFSETNFKNIIIVDDILDTGGSVADLKKLIKKTNVYIATVFVKEKNIEMVNFYSRVIKNNKWIEFPYEENKNT